MTLEAKYPTDRTVCYIVWRNLPRLFSINYVRCLRMITKNWSVHYSTCNLFTWTDSELKPVLHTKQKRVCVSLLFQDSCFGSLWFECNGLWDAYLSYPLSVGVNDLDWTCTRHCRQAVLHFRPTLPIWDLWSSKTLSSLFQLVQPSFWKIHQYRNSERVNQNLLGIWTGQRAKFVEGAEDDGFSLLGKYNDQKSENLCQQYHYQYHCVQNGQGATSTWVSLILVFISHYQFRILNLRHACSFILNGKRPEW
jgi:hypothetical protein